MFTLYSVYWALDICLLWLEYHTLDMSSLMRPESQDVHLKGPSSTIKGLSSQYFTAIYVQYIAQLTLVSIATLAYSRSYASNRLYWAIACHSGEHT